MKLTGSRSGSNSRFADLYLERYASGQEADLPQPDPDLFLCVVIPSYKEPDLITSIVSLFNCYAPGVKWEVIVVVNYPSGSPQETIELSLRNMEEIDKFNRQQDRPDVDVHALWWHAGVGLARKIGMDEAVRRFNLIGNQKGIIVGFDADSQCSPDFLKQIVTFYKHHPKANSANHYFEHPLHGNLDAGIYRSIAEYELYLRYLRFAIEFTGHPHAIHTVGSSFSVRADTYVGVNGMGKHAAGEDFYFLHKCIALERFYEINTLTVYPSPRESDRVIFGTGATIRKQAGQDEELKVYDIGSFMPLRDFFRSLPEMYNELPGNTKNLIDSKLPQPLQEFLRRVQGTEMIARIARETGSYKSFQKRFFAWFNGFMVLRFLNYYHEQESKVGILECSGRLASILNWEAPDNILSMLDLYRSAERMRGIRRIN
jgi:hypothetical protein